MCMISSRLYLLERNRKMMPSTSEQMKHLSESQRNHSQTVVACTPATMETLATTLASAAGAFFFMEARLLINTTSSEAIDVFKEAPTLVSEIKLCVHSVNDLNVPIFTRTGGVLLIAGVGSYCAYRLSRRFLASWTLLESTRCDLLAHADSRLLHTASEGFYDVRVSEGDLYQMERFLDTVETKTLAERKPLLISASGERCGIALIRKMVEKVESRNDSGLAEICKDNVANLPPQKNDTSLDSLQLFASMSSTSRANSSTLNAQKEKNSPNICSHLLKASSRRKSRPICFSHDSERLNTLYSGSVDNSDDSRSLSAQSELTSVSRIYNCTALRIAQQEQLKQNCAAQQKRSASTDTVERHKLLEDDIERCDKHSDTASTSFQLVWQDEPSWDNEFPDESDLDNCTSPTPSGISNLSAVKNIEALFENHERRDAAALNQIFISPKKQLNKKGTPSSRIKSGSSLRRHCLREDDKISLVSYSQTSHREGVALDETASVLSSRWDEEILKKCLNDNIDYMYHSTIDYRNHFEPSDKESRSENNSQLYKGCSNSRWANDEDNTSDVSSTARFIARMRSNTPMNRHYFSEGLWELTSTASHDSSSSAPISHEMIGKLEDDVTKYNKCESKTLILCRFDITKNSRKTASQNVKPVRTGEQVRSGDVSDYSHNSSSFDSNSLSITGRSTENDDTYHSIKCNRPCDSSVMFDSAIALTESISSAIGCTLTSENETD